ncbi:MAG: CHAT domain-containing protein [Candidatus Aminicenantes bacterium]|nr:CHAT domain-containing protein [Candidatus Aminicenantes bacterium]
MVERAKAIGFLESLRDSQSILRNRLSPDREEEERMISLKISTLMNGLLCEDLNENDREKLLEQLVHAEDEYVVFLSKVRRETPELRYILSPEHIRVEEVQQKLLDEKTALIEYFLGDEQSFMILITKENFSLFLLPSIEEIRESIKPYLKILSDPPAGRFKGKLAAHRVYKELVYPAERLLSEEIENLIIIPDGILYYLPFETLIRLMPVESDEAGFLVSRYRVSYAPSCSSLLLLSEKTVEKEHPKSFLAFGNPAYTSKRSNKVGSKTSADILRELYESEGFDFLPLPYSEKEVKKISRFFPNTKKSIYLKEKAQEESLKRTSLKDYQVIHFACHGFLDEKAPFRSALVLSLTKGQDEDGFLQVREIYNLRLAADLIVLSACQTGRGTLEKGEGVLGLPRVFFFAGAKSVVSTLWRIGDKPTAQFMQYFYKMLSQGMGKAQSLRLAKMKMLESKYSHPYYWAAFVLNGEPNSCLKFD